MKKQRITVITAKLLAAVMMAAVVFGTGTLEARAESTGTVTVDNAKVRSDASTDSSTISTLANGTTLTVNGEKTDSSGNVWYQVTLSDGKTGYVRSDLMSVTESADAADIAADADAGAAEAALDNIITPVAGGVDISAISNPDDVTPQDLQAATINTNGKVRANASTSDDIVAQLSQGTEMVISGSKLGSDSKTWYYVTFVDGGATKTGYIRSDLVDIGEVIVMPTAAPEEQPAEAVEEEPVVEEVNNDYELVYTDDGTGNNVWWLYNHIDNTREKLQELLDFADSQASKTATLTAANQKLKIICIVLGALLAIAIIAVIIMAVKLAAGGYDYDDDDDDDDEDDEEDDEPVRSRRSSRSSRRRYDDDDDDDNDDDDDEEEERRPRRRSSQTSSRDRNRAPRRRVEYDEDDDIKADTAPKKNKPKNFMLDDDDFEFEFLNMDDK